ncbi:DUF3278 domain-containing protein [Streptococcus suis]|nr:DUF3278 domain-containing protein [Streptococcus suis]
MVRFIRFFYDIVGEIDKDKYAALMNFGNNMYMLFTIIMVVTFFISLLLGEDIIGISLFIVFSTHRSRKNA